MKPGERVERLRGERGWTQAILAARIGKSQTWVSRLEAGEIKTIPVKRIADEFGLSEKRFLEGVDLVGFAVSIGERRSA